MKLNIKTSLVKLDELIKYVHSCKTPALLLNRELRLVEKNKSAVKEFRGIRRGRSIRDVLSKEGEKQLLDMKEGQVNFVTVSGREKADAAVLKKDEHWLIELDPGLKDIRDGLEKIYNRSSGYDVSVNAFEPDSFDGKALLDAVLQRLDRYRFRNETEVGCFDAASILHGIQHEISAEGFDLGGKMNIFGASRERLLRGSEKAYALISVYLFQLCHRLSRAGVTEVSIFEEGDRVNLIFEIIAEKAIRELEVGGEGYRLYLIKLLSEGNLWDFKIDRDPENKLQLILSAKSAIPSEDCLLRDVPSEYIRTLVTHIFGRSE